MIDQHEMFWDSCVFIRYLTRSPAAHLEDIDQFIDDAKRGDRRIYFSTVAFAEIRPEFFSGHSFGTIEEFFADLGRAFIAVEPNPNVMVAAGRLRGIAPINPGDPKIDAQRKRVIGTADAIHLTTRLYIRDVLEVKDIVFHTFDNGKGKNHEGRCVPLLGFERWYPPSIRQGIISEVCGLPRSEPIHPQRKLDLGEQNG